MGNSKSKQRVIDPNKLRIRQLGETFPFGDEELDLLCKCHRNQILSKGNLHHHHQPSSAHDDDEKEDNSAEKKNTNDGSSSFLLEVAICSIVYPSNNANHTSEKEKGNDTTTDHDDDDDDDDDGEPKNERMTAQQEWETIRSNTIRVVSFIEEHVLPPDFGRVLERVAFTSSSSSNHHHEDEEDKLNTFLNGMTRCFGRRGARSALEVVFECCCCFCKEDGNTTGQAKAFDLIDLGYRLALACDLLCSPEKATDEHGNLDPSRYILSPDFEFALVAMSRSLWNASQKADSSPAAAYRFDANGVIQGNTTNTSTSSTTTSSNETPEKDLKISKTSFFEWAEASFPLFSATMPTFFHHILFPQMPFSPSRTPFLFPKTKSQSSAFFVNPITSPRLFSFACMSPSLNGAWHRLYTTDSDGLSFNRLQLSLLGYDGPTLTIIRATNATSSGITTFGAYTASAWKESKDFYGTSDCFLYQMEPTTAIMRPRGMVDSTNYMYCNSEARSKGFDKLCHGIGFGGTNLQPRLYISESFEGCIASSRDMTFEQGQLLPLDKNGNLQKYFEIESLEVWGVGGDDIVTQALGARGRQREIMDANIRKAKKVDKAQFMDDFKSGLIESKAFKHREEMRGNAADCGIDELDAKSKGTYEYAK